MNPELVLDQGSPAWLSARQGRITGSRMADVLANPTTKRYNGYLNELIRYHREGTQTDERTPQWALHGLKYEPYARAAYQWEIQESVRECGLFIHPEESFVSASPDGVVEKWDSVIEIKCRSSRAAHQKCVDRGKCPPENYAQVQMEILCSGAAFCDFISAYYDPEGIEQPDIWICRVQPDPEYILKMIDAYCQFWEKIQTKLKEKI